MMDAGRVQTSKAGPERKVVAILGASGYIGKQLVEELRRQTGWRIKILARSPDQVAIAEAQRSGVELCQGDLLKPETLRGFFESGCTVINLVYLWDAGEAINLQVTSNLLVACRDAGIGRMIHCSTAAVVGRTDDDLITEETPCRPVTVYGVTKLKIEHAIVQAARDHFDVVILRPTSVFGPEGNPLKKLAGDIVAGSRLKNYLKSCLFGRRRMNLVPVANVLGAIIYLMRSAEDFSGGIFIISDDDSPINNFVDVEDFLRREFKVGGYFIPRIILPSRLLGLLLVLMGRNNVNPRCNFASNKLSELGFTKMVPFEAALAEYASWYKSKKLGRA